MSLKETIANLGKKKTKTTISAKVLFHKEANGLAEHGTIYADHFQFGLKNEPVRFSFEGIAPPNMTPEVLNHIFDQAERQGFTVHCLRSYANILGVTQRPNLRTRDEETAPVLEADSERPARSMVHSRRIRPLAPVRGQVPAN